MAMVMSNAKRVTQMCESCRLRPRGAGGKLRRCLQCLQRLVERDRRLRAERAALRADKSIRARLQVSRLLAEGKERAGSILPVPPGDRAGVKSRRLDRGGT